MLDGWRIAIRPARSMNLMLQDRAKIYIKSGDGGRGIVSFLREKYVPFGGPDGGDGGKGGDIVFVVDDQLSTLMPFRHTVHFRAEDGHPGGKKNMRGRSGEDLRIRVPPGTVISDDETGELLCDLTEPGEEALIAAGGVGGLGNARFKSSINQAPRIAELGEPGIETWLRLELKMIADVGLVGLPNAGKSTLLAAVSAARPKIADYPFTTLQPNLGFVEIGGAGGPTFVLADIPGLIDGAAEGVGLGLDFLRHVERCRMLIHLIDGSGGLEGRDPVVDYQTIRDELQAYSPELAAKPSLVAINKLDLTETREYLDLITEELPAEARPVWAVSAATGEGVSELMIEVGKQLQSIPIPEPKPANQKVYTLEDAEDTWNAERLSRHHFEVTGVKIERTLRMTDFSLEEAAERFQRILESSGISAALTDFGIVPGDVVHIAGAELIWDQAALDAERELQEGVTRRMTRRERIEKNFGLVEEVEEVFEP